MKANATLFVVAVLGFMMPALADQAPTGTFVVYPTKGQTPEVQKRDQDECQVWARDTTHVDPLQLASNAAESPAAAETSEPKKGGRLRGAVGGAAAGAVIGQVAGNQAGKGAAIGAVAGTFAAGAKLRRAKRAAEQEQKTADQAEQQRQQQVRDQLAQFNKAYSACLEGRGYTVK